MTKILKGLCVSALALSFAAAPAVAAPFIPTVAAPDGSSVEQVQYNPNWRMERRIDRAERRAERREMRQMERRGDHYYYNGYRGFRDRRAGYREFNGVWFPAAAFIAGAIVTGAIQAERGAGNHVDWCYDRYRSYRAADNSYNPGRGMPRRQCNSPFD